VWAPLAETERAVETLSAVEIAAMLDASAAGMPVISGGHRCRRLGRVCRFARDLRLSLWGEHLLMGPTSPLIRDPIGRRGRMGPTGVRLDGARSGSRDPDPQRELQPI